MLSSGRPCKNKEASKCSIVLGLLDNCEDIPQEVRQEFPFCVFFKFCCESWIGSVCLFYKQDSAKTITPNPTTLTGVEDSYISVQIQMIFLSTTRSSTGLRICSKSVLCTFWQTIMSEVSVHGLLTYVGLEYYKLG